MPCSSSPSTTMAAVLWGTAHLTRSGCMVACHSPLGSESANQPMEGEGPTRSCSCLPLAHGLNSTLPIRCRGRHCSILLVAISEREVTPRPLASSFPPFLCPLMQWPESPEVFRRDLWNEWMQACESSPDRHPIVSRREAL